MEASWEPPQLMEVEDGDWVYQGRTEYYVNCHVQVTLRQYKAKDCSQLIMLLA